MGLCFLCFFFGAFTCYFILCSPFLGTGLGGGQWGACNTPPLCGQQTGTGRKCVPPYSLHGLNAITTKQYIFFQHREFCFGFISSLFKRCIATSTHAAALGIRLASGLVPLHQPQSV